MPSRKKSVAEDDGVKNGYGFGLNDEVSLLLFENVFRDVIRDAFVRFEGPELDEFRAVEQLR